MIENEITGIFGVLTFISLICVAIIGAKFIAQAMDRLDHRRRARHNAERLRRAYSSRRQP